MPIYIDMLLRLALWLLLAPLLPGVINKVKAWVAGRQGPPVLQLYYDLARLWRKGVVLSTLASPGFVIAPAIAWTAVIAAALLLPLAGAGAPLSFDGDVLLLVYLLALARFCTAWGAMETGSAFEGMGAAPAPVTVVLGGALMPDGATIDCSALVTPLSLPLTLPPGRHALTLRALPPTGAEKRFGLIDARLVAPSSGS